MTRTQLLAVISEQDAMIAAFRRDIRIMGRRMLADRDRVASGSQCILSLVR
jgi:hypothetical protein